MHVTVARGVVVVYLVLFVLQLDVRALHFGVESVEGVGAAELDVMLLGGVIVEVVDGHEVVDARGELRTELIVEHFLVLLELAVGIGAVREQPVTVVTDGEVGEELRTEKMVPTYATEGVAPMEVFGESTTGIVLVGVVFAISGSHFKSVLTLVETQEEAVGVAELVVDLGVEVVEIEGEFIDVVGTVVQTHTEFDEPVDVTAAGRDHERGAVLDDRTLQFKVRGEQSDREETVIVLHVAILGADVGHGRESATVTGWKGTSEEIDVLHGVGHESRLETEHVVHVVEHDAVQQEEVLVQVAASDAELAGAGKTGLHTGQYLERLENVGLAQHGGHLLNLLDGDGRGTHACAGSSRLGSVTLDDYLLQHLSRLQGIVLCHVTRHVDGGDQGLVTDVGDDHRLSASGHRHRVKTIGIGDGACPQGGTIDVGTDKGLARLGVGDITM